jgi:hypothetical protein
MSSDPKQAPSPEAPAPIHRDKGIRIFTYPKTIFIFPTMVIAVICGIAMTMLHNKTGDPVMERAKAQTAAQVSAADAAPAPPAKATSGPAARRERFRSPQNLIGILFLGILGFNLVIMALDFPRFTIVGLGLLVLLISFILLWIGAYFQVELLRPAQELFGSIYVVANAEFYFMVALILFLLFIVIYATRYLDYWEILPNEILHHHGPLSDLERYPTMNLKFDKEIPDVLEFLLLGAGRLVLHVTEERKALVLDNVLFISAKEEALKKLMSRLEVRVTTDKEVAGP